MKSSCDWQLSLALQRVGRPTFLQGRAIPARPQAVQT